MDNTATARSHILTEAGTNELEIMSFILRWTTDGTESGERITTFGINAAKVKELVAIPSQISKLPTQPASMDGVFILRDRIIPLVDLCRWFGYQVYDPDGEKKGWVVIIVEIYAKQFGFIVHGVDKVYRVSWKNVEPPPPYLNLENQCIVANARIHDQIIQMVDFEKVVASVDPSVNIDQITAQLAASEETQTDAEGGPSPVPVAPGTVLFADDSRMIRDQVTKVLRAGGYTVIQAVDGLNAWDLLQGFKTASEGNVKASLQAIITDVEMPRIDGHHLCKKIKADPAFSGVPVILFSSLISDSLRNKGVAVGADDQVSKPDLPALVHRVREAVLRLSAPPGSA